MEKLPVTTTIITRNEADRIEEAVRSALVFSQEVIVVDSGSVDQTSQKAEASGARVVKNDFVGFGQQKNFAASLAKTEWVLNIDADERISPETAQELKTFLTSVESRSTNGVYLPRKTWYLNRWVMHGGWYPNYLLRLARVSESKWTEPSLHESLEVKGTTRYFRHPILHYSFPKQRAHILKNVEYADRAKQSLLLKNKQAGLLDLTLRPIWKFIDGYVLKLGFLDGVAGFFIAIHSAYALFLRYAYLYEETHEGPHSR